VAFYEVRLGYELATTVEADSYTFDDSGAVHFLKDNAEVAWVRYPDAIWLAPPADAS
jgi:hypothetical protein